PERMIFWSQCAENRVHSITRENGSGKMGQQNKAAGFTCDVQPGCEIQHTMQERELSPGVQVREKSDGSAILHPFLPPSTPHTYNTKHERQHAEIISRKLIPWIHSGKQEREQRTR